MTWACLQNFDEVLVPADHVSRSPNDTYYVDSETGAHAAVLHGTCLPSRCMLRCSLFARKMKGVPVAQ